MKYVLISHHTYNKKITGLLSVKYELAKTRHPIPICIPLEQDRLLFFPGIEKWKSQAECKQSMFQERKGQRGIIITACTGLGLGTHAQTYLLNKSENSQDLLQQKHWEWKRSYPALIAYILPIGNLVDLTSYYYSALPPH